MKRKQPSEIIPQSRIERAILVIRGHKVIVDAELAALYGVPTKRLNEQVRRNAGRFPEDFMFVLTREEKAEVVAICDHLGSLKFSAALPRVFTEHGAIMAANVLNSPRAVEMSVHIVRAFIRLRETALRYEELARALHNLEKRVGRHDVHLTRIVQRLRELTEPPRPRRSRRIGFITTDDDRE